MQLQSLTVFKSEKAWKYKTQASHGRKSNKSRSVNWRLTFESNGPFWNLWQFWHLTSVNIKPSNHSDPTVKSDEGQHWQLMQCSMIKKSKNGVSTSKERGCIKALIYLQRSLYLHLLSHFLDFFFCCASFVRPTLSWHYDIAKKDRRSSGGTLRHKFNLIDIWHLTFDIWHLFVFIWHLTFDV